MEFSFLSVSLWPKCSHHSDRHSQSAHITATDTAPFLCKMEVQWNLSQVLPQPRMCNTCPCMWHPSLTLSLEALKQAPCVGEEWVAPSVPFPTCDNWPSRTTHWLETCVHDILSSSQLLHPLKTGTRPNISLPEGVKECA